VPERDLAGSLPPVFSGSGGLLFLTMNYSALRFMKTLQSIAVAGSLAESNALKIELADLFLEMIGFDDPTLLPKPVAKRMEHPSVEQIREFCASKAIPSTDADWFFHKMIGCGWTNGGKPVRSWQNTLIAWKLGNYLPSLKNGCRNGGCAPPNEIRAELSKLHNQIRKGDTV